MTRKYSRPSTPNHRVCNVCNGEFPATTDFFVRDSSRTLGIAYECKTCHSKRRKGRPRHKERSSQLFGERYDKLRARQKRYNKTIKGRAISLRKAYQRIDACDLSVDEVINIIEQPCAHCGTTEQNRGLDRIDNSLPHIKGNVAPSCAPCNFARGNRFTFAEMQRIGVVIRAIFQDRKTTEVDSGGRQENLG
jgi:hypothetical protein